jgi:hypothetical protein
MVATGGFGATMPSDFADFASARSPSLVISMKIERLSFGSGRRTTSFSSVSRSAERVMQGFETPMVSASARTVRSFGLASGSSASRVNWRTVRSG